VVIPLDPISHMGSAPRPGEREGRESGRRETGEGGGKGKG